MICICDLHGHSVARFEAHIDDPETDQLVSLVEEIHWFTIIVIRLILPNPCFAVFVED